jgi:hypothetical protein
MADNNFFVIGCGGGGSILTPVLARLVGRENVTLVDGDALEKKNLDRQLFRESDIGRNKAEALAELHGLGDRYVDRWFALGKLRLESGDWLMLCVDNHAARRAALQECDQAGCRTVIAANEMYSAEAFYYERSWRRGPLDPRVYYPEIESDRTGDPQRAQACTGAAQEANRQLITANMMAVSLALHLLTVWLIKAPEMKPGNRQYLPYHLRSNLARLETFRVCDREKGPST